MVTGDHPETARYVARELGLGDDDGSDLRVVTGDQLTDGEEWEEGLRERLLEAQVVARVDPEEKMRLVELHQGDGAILAMTGDGVNDAPALRSADIGIAMGRRGTEVAREAADVVLLDDAFATIVSAVEEGRTIFRNVRRFVVYLLSGNVGEIVAVGAAAVASLPLPLLPLQILYLNLVNDVFPSLALGVGPSEPDLMDGPPRDPEEGIMDAAHWGVTVGYGLMIAGVVLGVLLTGLNVLGLGEAEAVTVSFLALSLGRLTHVFNMRDAADPPFRNEVTRNPLVWAALALCLGLLAVALFVPPLPGILHLVVPGAAGWGLAVGGALTVPLLGQLGLAASRLLARSRA
jgi:Ca2+-transporting ATPase